MIACKPVRRYIICAYCARVGLSLKSTHTPLLQYLEIIAVKIGESINTGLDYWNGGLTFFNALYLVIPTSHVHT